MEKRKCLNNELAIHKEKIIFLDNQEKVIETAEFAKRALEYGLIDMGKIFGRVSSCIQ